MQTDTVMAVQVEIGDFLMHEDDGLKVINITEDWENPDLIHITIVDDEGYSIPVPVAPFDLLEIVVSFEDEAPED